MVVLGLSSPDAPMHKDTTPLSERIVELIIPVIVAAIVSWLTTISTLQVEVAEVRKTEEAHFQEIQRAVLRLEGQISTLTTYLINRSHEPEP